MNLIVKYFSSSSQEVIFYFLAKQLSLILCGYIHATTAVDNQIFYEAIID